MISNNTQEKSVPLHTEKEFPAMLHKAKVAAVAALAEGLGANEVDVMQVAV